MIKAEIMDASMSSAVPLRNTPMILFFLQRMRSGIRVKGSWMLNTTWLKIRILNVSTPIKMMINDGIAVMKVETRYRVVLGSSGRPKNPVMTFTSAIEEVTDDPTPAKTNAIANRRAARGPARGVKVRDAYSMLSTAMALS